MYNADGGLIGELRYAWGKVTARAHCSLCDLTHRGLTKRGDWNRVAAGFGVPVTLLHRNELDDAIRASAGDDVPCVLARRGDRLDVVLAPRELAACDGDPREFDRRLRAQLAPRRPSPFPDDPSDRR